MNETRDLTDAEGLALLRQTIETASTIDDVRRAELLGRLDRGGLTDALRAELVALMDDEAAFVEADIARGERQLGAWESELAALKARLGRTVTPPAAPDDGQLLEEFAREVRRASPEARREAKAYSDACAAAFETKERRAFWWEMFQGAARMALLVCFCAAVLVYLKSR